MEWKHKVDQAWLDARREVITATELVGLKTGASKFTKAQKAGESIIPSFAALWAKKNQLVQDDPVSYGAAARGHILEPYAIDYYASLSGLPVYHWDDTLIINGSLGFSPDGFDIQMAQGCPTTMKVISGELVGDNGVCLKQPTHAYEVKSYGAENHIKAIFSKKTQIKERYQLAVAMACIPELEHGTLLFFNPNLPKLKLSRVTYDRSELADEIEEMYGLLDLWERNVTMIEAAIGADLVSSCIPDEDDIYKEYLEDFAANPW